ncbi:MAG: hypothetical protein Q7S65_06645 [Nanoarchaeota archaeon]|nr:hypothetical protein [Nanoarchaeota archaeon]
MVIARVQEWKGLPIVELSSAFLKREGLHIGDRVTVRITKVRKDGFGMFKGLNLPPYSREHEEHEY